MNDISETVMIKGAVLGKPGNLLCINSTWIVELGHLRSLNRDSTHNVIQLKEIILLKKNMTTTTSMNATVKSKQTSPVSPVSPFSSVLKLPTLSSIHCPLGFCRRLTCLSWTLSLGRDNLSLIGSSQPDAPFVNLTRYTASYKVPGERSESLNFPLTSSQHIWLSLATSMFSSLQIKRFVTIYNRRYSNRQNNDFNGKIFP
ncbi:hypothetical protein QQP08_015536 [Theobroma cacao]|nr:hypothetical protein QQP08_015536 [Theobroma cacao]